MFYVTTWGWVARALANNIINRLLERDVCMVLMDVEAIARTSGTWKEEMVDAVIL